MTKTETVPKKKKKKISVCDILKTDTTKVIQKLESQIPTQFQQYSDLYTSYLHTMDDVYGTCYIAEKDFFDNLNIDQGILKSLQEYSNTSTDAWLAQITVYAKYRQEFLQMQISSMKIYDDFLHTMMGSYAKTLSGINNAIKSSTDSSK